MSEIHYPREVAELTEIYWNIGLSKEQFKIILEMAFQAGRQSVIEWLQSDDVKRGITGVLMDEILRSEAAADMITGIIIKRLVAWHRLLEETK